MNAPDARPPVDTPRPPLPLAVELADVIRADSPDRHEETAALIDSRIRPLVEALQAAREIFIELNAENRDALPGEAVKLLKRAKAKLRKKLRAKVDASGT